MTKQLSSIIALAMTLNLPAAVQAQLWQADELKVTVRREIAGVKAKLPPRFDYLCVEITGNFKCSMPNRSVVTHLCQILKVDAKNPALKKIPDNFQLVAVGAPGESGASYPALDAEMREAARRQPIQERQLPLGDAAILEQNKMTNFDPAVRLLKPAAPLAFAFRFPTPKESTIQLALSFDGVEMPLPDLQCATADLGYEIPKEQQAAAKKAFGAKLPFFLWTEKGPIKAKDFQLRFAINPAVKMEELLGEDDIATRAQFVYTAENGQRVPFTSTHNGHFGLWAAELSGPNNRFKGRGTATLCLVRASADPKMDPARAKPISNEITVPLVFD